jgi:HK97 family phage major capsid protein
MSDAKKTGPVTAEELGAFRQEVAELDRAILSKRGEPEKIEKGVAAIAKRQANILGRQSDFAVSDEADVTGAYRDVNEARRELIEKSAKTNEALKDFHDWNDACHIMHAAMKRQGVDIRKSAFYRRGLVKHAKFVKALSTGGSATGTEFIPTQFSGELFDLMRLERVVPTLFRTVQMPSKSFTLPTAVSDMTVYKVAESTDSTGTEPTEGTRGTGNVTLTGVKMAVETFFSDEMDEDSIIPVVDFVRQGLAEAHAEGLEACILNGDTTAAGHQDFGLVTSSADRRKCWNGLRKIASTGSDTTSAGGDALTETDLQNAILAMGKYAVSPKNLVLLVGTKGYAKLRALTNVWTVDKKGGNAVINTGELKDWGGIPVVVSDCLADAYNASGVYDGTTTTLGVLIFAHKPSFVLGLRRAMRIRSWENVKTEQTVMVCSTRADFKSLRASTEPVCQTVYNFLISAA